ncbi:MAG TPA: class I SAM-dependent methyltransferase [Candidatus Deferrimicrobiaceae bacterium]
MTTERTFLRHEIEWTRERASRIWDYIGSNKAYEDLYFSRRHGESLIRYLRRRRLPFSGRMLDFGCGPGFFLEMLLRRGIGCEGIDFSEASVRLARERLESYPSAGPVILAPGFPLPIESDAFDVVFFIETIEHLLPDDLDATVAELRRVTRQAKLLVVTTPNDENLEGEKVLCPECGCVFHRIQHVRAWTAASLSNYMSGHGFARVTCEAVTLTERSLRSRVVTAWNAVSGSKKPHLVYIGRKI